MARLKLEWTVISKPQFDNLRLRAHQFGLLDEFVRVHNRIVRSLVDLSQAVEKGEPLYHTRKPGGTVRLCVSGFLAVTYVVFPAEQLGWVLKYQCFPESWPNPL